MIADIFIKRPVTAIVISVVILLVGVLSLLNLPISQYPQITPPTVQITSNYTGADAKTVEETVTTPIETQVNGVPGAAYINSNSSATAGQSIITVTLDIGADVDVATLDIQNRVGIATPILPDLVKRLGVVTRKRNPSIFMLVGIYSPNGTHSVPFVDNYANIYVHDLLLRVPGVGDIISRADDFSMRIWLKADKLASLGLTPSDVVSALQEQNLDVALGTVGASPQANTTAFEYTVFSHARLVTEAEFENVVVRSIPKLGAVVKLKDVARVELGKFNYNNNSFVDGVRGSYLLVYQSPNSNALATAEGVYAALNKLKKTFPKDLDYVVPFEAVSVVRESIREVVYTLLEALALVALVVFFFLQSWRATVIPLLAIPVCIIGTFIFFIPLGFSINTLTLFGLVLAIGIVVDDAIVVVEAVQHYMDNHGLSAKEATIRAMKDISGPVVAIALILAAVFVPVGFIPGIVGRLYQQFAITVAVSVLLSAFVALSFTPALCMLMLKPYKIDQNSRGLNFFFFRFNTWFSKVTQSYTRSVQAIIKKAPLALVLLACLYVATGVLFKDKATAFIPLEDEGRMYVTYEIPEASSTVRSIKVLDTLMKIIRATPGVNHVGALGGFNVATGASKSNSGTLFVSLKDWDERKDKSLQLNSIMTYLNQRFSKIKEAQVVVIPPPAIPGLGNTGGFSFQLQQIQTNDDLTAFQNVLNHFLTELRKRPEIGQAFSFFNANAPAYNIEVDREKAKKMGVSVADVYTTLQTYLGSMYINDFVLYGRTFRVLAQADTGYRGDIKNTNSYYVRNSSNQMLPMSELVSYKPIESASFVSHYNLYRSAEVNGGAAPGYSSGDAIKALEEVAAKNLPPGYGYEFSGLSLQEIKAGNSSIYIFALSLVFVFLFLAALYESWSIPFSVLLAVPIGAFGAILALTLLPKLTNNVYTQIGLITLIGLSAKNAILIVEFAKERVDQGEPVLQSILEAVYLRLRPILMTSCAFILGVIPLAMATGAGSVARSSIGWTVLGGMLAATMLSIFIVPVLFVVISRLAKLEKKPL